MFCISAATEKMIHENRDWIMEQTKYKADESKRIGGIKKDFSEIFGMVGSFRQLDFD